MMNDYRTFGLPEHFVQTIAATPPAKLWYPTRNELITADVLNADVLPRQ
jgi:hypothetical protein